MSKKTKAADNHFGDSTLRTIHILGLHTQDAVEKIESDLVKIQNQTQPCVRSARTLLAGLKTTQAAIEDLIQDMEEMHGSGTEAEE